MDSQKSEMLHFHEFLLSKSYKVSAEKVQKSYLSWHWRVMQSLKKTDMWFQIWHEEFGEFSSNYSEVWKFLFDGLFLSKVYKVWATKIQRSYFSWHLTVMQSLNKLRPCSFKNGVRNWVNFSKFWKIVLWWLFLSKHIMLQLENFIETMCHDTEGWCNI